MSEQLLQELLTELKAMRKDISTMQSDFSNMQSFVSNIQSDISTIQKTMATKDDVADIPAIKIAIFESSEIVKRIESTQERHECTLDLLSRRSIDQEAELRRIK